MSNLNNNGAEWAKWDLHVHTPDSMVHNFKSGEQPNSWDNYILDLENLPEEIKVLGINDYFFLDGYRKVLDYKKNGRLQNIELILPIIEFRLKKFAGHKQFKRINFHVIFSNEISPDIIQSQFLNSLSASYSLTPGLSGPNWSGVVTPDSLKDLGNQIIASNKAGLEEDYGSPLEEGFNNLNLDEKDIIERLEKSTYFIGKYLLAIGKTEWDSLPWMDGSIAEKKDVINKANIVFTASESYESFQKAKTKLKEQGVNDLLLDCSDAHHNSSSKDKDRIGNCFTWIKAERTFNGLKQIINESERVFIGSKPEVLDRVDGNKTKYIKSLTINKIASSNLKEKWFEKTEITFNKELVAIIGNKGNGKSAIADIIGLCGGTKNYNHFSFLTSDKFRKPNPNRSLNFEANLIWESNAVDTTNLGEQIDKSKIEKVKFIPQNYLEILCNNDVDKLENELRKVIFSHVNEADKLKQVNLDDLLRFKTEVIQNRISELKSKLSDVNSNLIILENKTIDEYKNSIKSNLQSKELELISHIQSKPEIVLPPSENETIVQEQVDITSRIEALKKELIEIENSIKEKKAEKTNLTFNKSELEKLLQSLKDHFDKFSNLTNEFSEIALKYGLQFPDLMVVTLNTSKIEQLISETNSKLFALDNILSSTNTSSLEVKRSSVKSNILELSKRLSEPAKIYHQYVESLKNWEIIHSGLQGKPDIDGTIAYFKSQLEYIEKDLPSEILATRNKRMDITKQIFKNKVAVIEVYKELYTPVTNFIEKDTILIQKYPISIDATLKLAELENKFFHFVSNGSKGTFYGKEDGSIKLKVLIENSDFKEESGIESFLSKLIEYLEKDMREAENRPKREILNQIKKGFIKEFYDFLFGLDYLIPNFELKLDNKSINSLSPGEKGALLLIFYLILDQDDIPLIIDQPEENLDNQSVYNILVPYIKEAKKRRQIIIVTHNPNLAVVCDAEQIIHVRIDKSDSNKVYILSGAIENKVINNKLVEILEGTLPAFNNRDMKYFITKNNTN